ncbi:hypothetical protein TDCHD05_20276 [Tenacibaculum dicentrarchi]|nr:hypothetical protein TNO021_430371 [Tenacibaculum dicentrarchi]SOU86758.1 hypothetical protein TDCHD05_20276 [Tenacibaculum dicentrarchi]
MLFIKKAPFFLYFFHKPFKIEQTMNTVKMSKQINMHLKTIMCLVQNPFYEKSKFPPINP